MPITVTGGNPAILACIGGVKGRAVTMLGIEHLGRTGTIRDLYRHFQIDADAIVAAASHLSPGEMLQMKRLVLGLWKTAPQQVYQAMCCAELCAWECQHARYSHRDNGFLLPR
ncbi:MAG: hypothetical protein WEA77_02815 [Hyphomonas sp.]|uniref:hypothetical protein n=1 Tax=Hyphomonas sp. TaxID=87 RepID=UPI0034A09F4B